MEFIENKWIIKATLFGVGTICLIARDPSDKLSSGNNFINNILLFILILYLYTITEKKFGLFINLFMMITYLICWFFVLKNANYYNVSFDCIKYFNEEPFSGLLLDYYDIK